MDATATRGLLAIGAGQVDLQPRFVRYGADHFAILARGDRPPKPDPLLAEITALVLAGTVGAEVPMPLDGRARLGRPRGSYKKEPAAGEGPTGPFEATPEAEAWMRSHGMAKFQKKTVAIVDAFMKHPTHWWKATDLAKALNRSRVGLTPQLGELRRVGIIVSQGSRAHCLWKLAEMPPHV